MSTLGTLLRKARVGLGLSLRDAASAHGVTHSTIRAWEDGRLLIAEEWLATYCDFLDVPLSEARALHAKDQLARDEAAIRRHVERLAARRARCAA